jgi:hypothetical protein
MTIDRLLITIYDVLYNFSRMTNINWNVIKNYYITNDTFICNSYYNNSDAILYLHNYREISKYLDAFTRESLPYKILNYLVENGDDIHSSLFKLLNENQMWKYSNIRKYLECCVCYEYSKSTTFKCRCKHTNVCSECSKKYGGCPMCREKNIDKKRNYQIRPNYNFQQIIHLHNLLNDFIIDYDSLYPRNDYMEDSLAFNARSIVRGGFTRDAFRNS